MIPPGRRHYIGTTEMFIHVLCPVCGNRPTYAGEPSDGKVGCTTHECSEFGKLYHAPTIDVYPVEEEPCP